MIVMKFGGTSVEDAESIERVAHIIRARLDRKPIVVVSAMGKTTRGLLEAARASAAGDRRTPRAVTAELKSRHSIEAAALVRGPARLDVLSTVDSHFDDLAKLLEGLAILGEVPARGLDKILSYGELLSSAVVAGALQERKIPARLLDSRDLIKTDEHYGAAAPIFELTNPLVRETLEPVIEAGFVPVIQGFIGSTRGGAGTTLGFEGSDYTATIVGAALGADDVEIWKDVSGLMTADPALFHTARTVKVCTYAEAAELTFFGAKVLHPKAVEPARKNNLPVHIYNSKKPDAVGTRIAASAPPCRNIIKSIAYKRPVDMAYAVGLGHQDHRRGLLDEVIRSFDEVVGAPGAAPLITTMSGSRIAMAFDSIEDCRNEGGAVGGSIRVQRGRAIVTVVGEGLSSRPDAAARVLEATRGIDIDLFIHGSSPIGMNLVVDQRDVETAVSRLHDVFFQDLDPTVFE